MSAENLPESLVINGSQICSRLVTCTSRLVGSVCPRSIAGALGRHHASLEDAVLFVEGLKIGLIFSNESTSGRLSICGQEQMEGFHIAGVLSKFNEIQKAKS